MSITAHNVSCTASTRAGKHINIIGHSYRVSYISVIWCRECHHWDDTTFKWLLLEWNQKCSQFSYLIIYKYIVVCNLEIPTEGI